MLGGRRRLGRFGDPEVARTCEMGTDGLTNVSRGHCITDAIGGIDK
jgi:hypothetical protein